MKFYIEVQIDAEHSTQGTLPRSLLTKVVQAVENTIPFGRIRATQNGQTQQTTVKAAPPHTTQDDTPAYSPEDLEEAKSLLRNNKEQFDGIVFEMIDEGNNKDDLVSLYIETLSAFECMEMVALWCQSEREVDEERLGEIDPAITTTDADNYENVRGTEDGAN